MAKIIVIKLKKAGNNNREFSVSDNFGNVLFASISKSELISGISIEIEDNVTVIILKSLDKNCCNKSWNIPVSTISLRELAAIGFQSKNTGSVWTHLTDTTIYNSFYGCIAPYIIEYPISYQYHDEILQNVRDYTKVFKYFESENGVYNTNRKIQTNDIYFNKAVLYNDQQSSGVITLVTKPTNNLSSYLTYPKYGTDTTSVIFTKRDNYYQFNSFFSIVKDETVPLFNNSCTSLSIDKEVNQDNMVYGRRSFQKYTLRAKDSKIRLYLDNTSDYHLVSQILIAPSQISYL